MAANMNSRENSGQNTQPHIRHGPDRRADQERGEQPRAGWFLPRNQQPGDRHGQAADQEIPGTSKADQPGAANGQRHAEQGDDDAQSQQENLKAPVARDACFMSTALKVNGKERMLAR